jgi:hypothetical protein
VSAFEAAVTTYIGNAETVLTNLKRLVAAVEGEVEAVLTDPEVPQETKQARVGRIRREAEGLVRRFREQFDQHIEAASEQIERYRRSLTVSPEVRSRVRALLDGEHRIGGIADRARDLGDADVLRALAHEARWTKVGDRYIADDPEVLRRIDQAILETDPNPEEKAVVGAALRLPGLQEQMDRQSQVAVKLASGKPTNVAKIAAGHAAIAAEREAAPP